MLSSVETKSDGVVAVYRHEAGAPDRYFYDRQLPNAHGWSDGVRAFRAHGAPVDGAVPIYQHRAKSGPDRYFLDTKIPNIHGWHDGTVVFYAFPAQVNGTVPIYSHRAKSGVDRYFYDTQVRNDYGWTEGVVAFYAYPPENSTLDLIAGVIGSEGGSFRGITYELTTDNTFALRDTPHVWGEGPTVVEPTAGSLKFLSDLRDTVASATTILDITLLWNGALDLKVPGMPDGGFLSALADGFAALVHAGRNPLVRILVGEAAPSPRGLHPPMLLFNWFELLLKQAGLTLGQVAFPVVASFTQSTLLTSWNHSKIVAADGRQALVGGHNLWATNYLGLNPVHDVSGLITGSAVRCAHGFCGEVWKAASDGGVLKAGSWSRAHPADFATPTLPPPNQTGSTRMLSLGRLGHGVAGDLTIATNASVSARVMAFRSATQIIRISQQTLYFSATSLDGGFDFATILALVLALRAGVKVQIVVSNDVPLSEGGYEGNLQQVLDAIATIYVAVALDILDHALIPAHLDDFSQWAHLALTSTISGTPVVVSRPPTPASYSGILSELNSRLSVARLHYADDISYWEVDGSKKNAANHAKVYIVDDSLFYVGSDNLYLSGTPHGLQEYGHLVEGKAETQAFIRDYWDKIWSYSGPHAVPASVARFVAPVPFPPMI
ncbi:hypothetical protein GCM10009747_07260 [Agromyces humatus]|uniref:PLD phosphodiesterase domain-containing protein n=2 Tax=Agromyces humatus TaxID=279573 RepID=A0ABP4WGC2_9MICO